MRPWTQRFLRLTSVALAALGCSSQPRIRPITGPDGTAMLHVSCPRDQSACFALAGERCPSGYKLFPIFDTRDNNFLVRCQRSAPGAETSVTAEVRALPATQPVAPAATRPWPVPDPWSTASTIPTKPPTTKGTANDSEIDLGY